MSSRDGSYRLVSAVAVFLSYRHVILNNTGVTCKHEYARAYLRHCMRQTKMFIRHSFILHIIAKIDPSIKKSVSRRYTQYAINAYNTITHIACIITHTVFVLIHVVSEWNFSDSDTPRAIPTIESRIRVGARTIFFRHPRATSASIITQCWLHK